jgi:peptidoglycan/xylan/chitin deacetylase (PgdA/CDA1 family)
MDAMAAATQDAPKPQNPGDTQVLKWKDGKRAAFVLAFDDSCGTHLKNVIPELRKRDMVGTFYVIAGNGNFKDHPEWAKEAKLGNVVFGNHTFTHSNCSSVEQLDDELTKASAAINQRVPDLNPNRLVSFGQPGGVKWTVTKEEIAAALAKHNLINRPPFWGAVLHVKTVADMNKYVDDAIKKGEMSHLDFHGVGGDWLVTPMDYFIPTLDKLQASRDVLWLTDHISAHKYQAERKTAEAKMLA